MLKSVGQPLANKLERLLTYTSEERAIIDRGCSRVFMGWPLDLQGESVSTLDGLQSQIDRIPDMGLVYYAAVTDGHFDLKKMLVEKEPAKT